MKHPIVIWLSSALLSCVPFLVHADTYVPLSGVPGFESAAGSGNFVDMINTIFKLSIGLGAVIAVFMIIIAGLQYATSINASTKNQLKERIIGALGGLVFLIAATAFLNIINPQLTALKVGEFDEVGQLADYSANTDGDTTDVNDTSGDDDAGGELGGQNPITARLFDSTVDDLDPQDLYEYIFEQLPESAFINASAIPSLPGGTAIQSDNPPVNLNASEPESTPAEDAAALQRNNNDRELRCMAVNMYYEARNQSDAGIEMVAHVTWNRVKSKQYKNTVCEVVYQYKQFSWTLDKSLGNHTPKDKAIMEKMLIMAHKVMYKGKKAPAPFDKSCIMFYKRTDNKGVSARSKKWFAKLRQIGAVGAHTFYCAK